MLAFLALALACPHEAQPAVGRALPTAALDRLFHAEDFRPATLAPVAGARLAVALDVNADGLVTACRVTGSSGVDGVDQAGCLILRRRARFRPALDAAGNRVADTVEAEIVLPAPPAGT